MMKAFLGFAYIALISFIFAENYSGSGYPYVKERYPIEELLSPIPLLTSAAKPISVPQLVLNIPKSSILQLTNTGNGVLGTPVRGKDVTLTGGPGLKDEYIFYKFNYHNDGVPNNTRAELAEDSVGTALSHGLIFYKKSLGSPRNALKYKYSDGFIVVLFQIQIVGNAPNSHFELYERALRKVRQPQQTTLINTKDAISWLTRVLPSCSYYFSWPGTVFGDPWNGGILGKQYPGAIIIQIPLRFAPYISYTQFDVYPSILNENGQSTTTVLGLYKTNGRPVVEISSGAKVHYCS